MISVLLWIAMQGVPQMRPEFCAINGETMQYEGDCAKPPSGASNLKTFTYAEPEPIDVPAVEEKADSELFRTYGDVWQCSNGGHMESGGQIMGCVGGKHWTCTDKSRVLLTSEDGHRWCHKVQP